MTTAPFSPTPFTDQGHGPIVVLLHSSMASKSQWRALSAELAPTHRAIAFDLYGYGAAPMPAGAASAFCLDDEARRVQHLLSRLAGAHEPVHLVGHSYGGAVALRLALALGPRVLSLSLYEPTAFHAVDGGGAAASAELREVRAVANAVRRCRFDDPADALAVAARFIDFWNGNEGALGALPASRQQTFAAHLPKVALDFQALFDSQLSAADYRELSAPTCLIGGLDSPACTRSVIGALAATLRHRALRTVDAGHMGPVTHPERVNPRILEFIRNTGRSGPPSFMLA